MSVKEVVDGRFRCERNLGHGGMAAVYLARDEELDRPVAVKLLADHLAGEPEIRERFLREARLAARLGHPNIVTVYDAGEDEGRPYIVMEYVEGETLADLLRRRGKLPPEEAVGLAIQACAGLEHAHAAGLVHRDVKPGNLLLRRDGTLKISDFGIARAAETTGLTEAGQILGTAAYLAPEQAAGEPVTAAADLYALGAVVYELLTGRPPYTADSLAQLVHKREGEPVPPVRDLAPAVPGELEDVVMRTLARLPDYRPASAAELARQLAQALPEPPTEPLPTASGVRASEVTTRVLPSAARTRVRAPLVWAAIALVTLVALVAFFAVSDDDEPASRAPARIDPVPRGDTPEDQARNLAEWLRAHSKT